MSAEKYPGDEVIDWRDRAACLDEDPETFFPIGESSQADLDTTRKAKAVCLRCDVREKCLQWALETDQRWGIWGGLTERERKKLKQGNGSTS